MTLRSQRGSGLLLAMIVVLVITVIAVGVVRFSSRELAGAYAGRQLLLSQFRALGVQPVALTALNVPLDNPATGQTRVLGGHYDSNVQVQQVSILPDGTFGPDPNSVQDRSNRIFVTRLGSGSPYKVMVHCQDRGDGTMNSGRQLEVEFGVRFGL
jgi:hypothetical protein